MSRKSQYRKKANAYLKSKLGHRWVRQTLGKATASNTELITRINAIDSTNYANLSSWCASRPDIPIQNKKQKAKTEYRKSSDKFLKSWEWRTLRFKMLTKYGRRCMCCGATSDDGETVMHVDHIKPRYKHPELALCADNLQILCGVCNQGKGAHDETDFRRCVEDEYDRAEREFQMNLADKATTYQ